MPLIREFAKLKERRERENPAENIDRKWTNREPAL